MIHDLFGYLSTLLHVLLPEWVRLPSLTFVLPHSMYWLGLILFPLFALFIIHRNKNKNRTVRPPVSLGAAYLLWFWGGFVGLHRFYTMGIKVGFVYIIFFILIIYGNAQGTQARNVLSDAANQLKISDFMVKKHQKDIDRGRSGAIEKLRIAEKKQVEARKALSQANLKYDQWRAFSGAAFATIVIFMLIDAILMPFYIRKCLENEPAIDTSKDFMVMERGSKADERAQISTPIIRFIESVSYWSGQFVAYWVIIAVFVYYYEVIARYVFNSPTNWAHESMFLMFGMQYLLTGAYAYRENSHVRVDVIYEKFSTRSKAIIDIVTSIFFFIFTVTLLITGYLFAKDSFDVFEISFTEWGIQYWPVKLTIVIGAFLLILQGVAKLMRDILYLRKGEN